MAMLPIHRTIAAVPLLRHPRLVCAIFWACNLVYLQLVKIAAVKDLKVTGRRDRAIKDSFPTADYDLIMIKSILNFFIALNA